MKLYLLYLHAISYYEAAFAMIACILLVIMKQCMQYFNNLRHCNIAYILRHCNIAYILRHCNIAYYARAFLHIVNYYEAVQHLRPRSPHLSHLTHQWSCLRICLCLCLSLWICSCLSNVHCQGQDHVLDKSATFVLLFVHNMTDYTYVQQSKWKHVFAAQDVEGD